MFSLVWLLVVLYNCLYLLQRQVSLMSSKSYHLLWLQVLINIENYRLLKKAISLENSFNWVSNAKWSALKSYDFKYTATLYELNRLCLYIYEEKNRNYMYNWHIYISIYNWDTNICMAINLRAWKGWRKGKKEEKMIQL